MPAVVRWVFGLSAMRKSRYVSGIRIVVFSSVILTLFISVSPTEERIPRSRVSLVTKISSLPIFLLEVNTLDGSSSLPLPLRPPPLWQELSLSVVRWLPTCATPSFLLDSSILSSSTPFGRLLDSLLPLTITPSAESESLISPEVA